MISYSLALGNENGILKSIDLTPYGEDLASPAENLGFSDTVNFLNGESQIVYTSRKLNTSKISFNIYCKKGVNGFLEFKDKLFKMINSNPDSSYYKLLFGVKRNSNSIRYAYIKLSTMNPQHLIGNVLPIQITLDRYSWWFTPNSYIEEFRTYTADRVGKFTHDSWTVSSQQCSEVTSPLIIELTSSSAINTPYYSIENFFRNASNEGLNDVCNDVFCKSRDIQKHILSNFSAPYFSKKYDLPIFVTMWWACATYWMDDNFDIQKNDGLVFGFSEEFQEINDKNIGEIDIAPVAENAGKTFVERRKFIPYFREA